MTVHTRIEQRRGCGYRKPGGFYLVSPPHFTTCCQLPKVLEVCSCCGQGIKPARGFTWINGQELFTTLCSRGDVCPMRSLPDKIGLLWIGEIYYKSAEHFMKENYHLGISRRINVMPKGFKIGETWLALAHRKGHVTSENGKFKFRPAVFCVFRPTALEYVVRETDTTEKLEKLEKRGVTLVKLVRESEATLL
jgi:hypothetical protein